MWQRGSIRAAKTWFSLSREAAELTLKMTLMWSPRGSTFWKDSFSGTALELKKEHNFNRGNNGEMF